MPQAAPASSSIDPCKRIRPTRSLSPIRHLLLPVRRRLPHILSMDGNRHGRTPSYDRILGILSTQPTEDSATSAGVELHEAEVLWTSAADASDPLSRASSMVSPGLGPLPSPSHRFADLRRQTDRSFGILAALPEDGNPSPSTPLLQRKPSSAFSSNTSSSSTATPAAAASRMIPPIPKPKMEYSLSMPAGRMHQVQSLPVNVPVVPRRGRRFEVEPTDGFDDGDRQGMMPPHEIVARTHGREMPMTTFSVLEGAGRTLKGRDLRRVRDAVFRQTGFLD